jgi:predicted ester cyclase
MAEYSKPPLFSSDGTSRRQRNQIQKVIDFFNAFNKRDLKTIGNMLAQRHIDRTFFGQQPIDRDATLRMFIGFLEVFPDWVENIDEVVTGEQNKLAVRHTGRGTQVKSFLGRAPDGKQLAATYTDILTFDDDDRIIEYTCGQFPFSSFWEEGEAAAENVMETRAEQGGTLISNAAREEIYAAIRDGAVDHREVMLAKAGADKINRCQALLETNFRRCFNQASHGSIYCELHTKTGHGPAQLPAELSGR